jgi:hypothetical protein
MITRKFTQEEDQFLRDNCLTIPKKRMSKMLCRSEASAGNRMKLLGIVVPAEVAQRFLKESFIKKGTKAFNKGKRMEDFMSPDAIERTMGTRFQKGGIPHNTRKADGVVSIRNNKGILSKWIRVECSKWQQLHHYNWLKAGKEIPKGNILIYKDGDPLNCELSNLECISRTANLNRNKQGTTAAERMTKRWRKKKDPEFAKELAEAERLKKKELKKAANKKRRIETVKFEKRIAKVLKQKQKIEAKKSIELIKVQKERQQEKRFEMKPVDLSNLEPLRIDHKTIVYLKPGQDKQAVIEKYLNRAVNF